MRRDKKKSKLLEESKREESSAEAQASFFLFSFHLLLPPLFVSFFILLLLWFSSRVHFISLCFSAAIEVAKLLLPREAPPHAPPTLRPKKEKKGKTILGNKRCHRTWMRCPASLLFLTSDYLMWALCGGAISGPSRCAFRLSHEGQCVSFKVAQHNRSPRKGLQRTLTCQFLPIIT